MPAFDSFFGDVGFPALADTFFGQVGTYNPADLGDPVSCQVIITHDVVIEPTSYESNTVTLGIVLEALVDDVGDVAGGDTFVVSGVTYACKKELENNGKITKWVVHDS